MPDGDELNNGWGGQGGQQPASYALTGGTDDYALTPGDSIWSDLSEDDKWLLGELGITDDRYIQKNQYESDSSNVLLVQKLLNIYNRMYNEGMYVIAETGNYNDETKRVLAKFQEKYGFAGRGRIDQETPVQIYCAINERNGTCQINRIDGWYLFNRNLDLISPDLTTGDVEQVMSDAMSYTSNFFFIKNLLGALTDFITEMDKMIEAAAQREAVRIATQSKLGNMSRAADAGETVFIETTKMDYTEFRKEIQTIKQAIIDTNPGAKYQLERRLNDMRNLFKRLQETEVILNAKLAQRCPNLAKVLENQLFKTSQLIKGAKTLGKLPWLKFIGAIIEAILAGFEVGVGIYLGDLAERRITIIKHTLNAMYQLFEALIVDVASVALVAAGHPIAAVMLGLGWMVVDLFFFSGDDTFGLPTRNLINDGVDAVSKHPASLPSGEFNGMIDISGAP